MDYIWDLYNCILYTCTYIYIYVYDYKYICVMLPLLVLVPQLHISLQGHSSSCECQNKFDQILAPRHCNSQPKVQRDVQTSWHLPWKKKTQCDGCREVWYNIQINGLGSEFHVRMLVSTRISHDFLRNTNECKSFPLLLGGGYIPTYIKHKEGQMKLSIAATWMSPKYSSTLSFLKVTWQIYVSLRISPNKSPKLLKGDCISLAKIINIYKYIYIPYIYIYTCIHILI